MDTRSATLQNEYQKRFSAHEHYREQVWAVLCKKVFSKHIRADDVVLDLGAGWGEFSRNIQAKQRYAMDLNPDCGKRIEGYSEFIQQDCSDPWPLADASLDVVFTSNFFEHLPSKGLVDKTLQEAHRCLKPGGIIICVGPNIQYLPDLYWDYWDHYLPISGASIAEALTLGGFDITQRIDRFLPYTMSGKKNPPLWAVSLYLDLPLFWPLLGKQFFVIGRK
jgi:ubiquinone/menaquinone biosynthesis C-methylase UbiE